MRTLLHEASDDEADDDSSLTPGQSLPGTGTSEEGLSPEPALLFGPRGSIGGVSFGADLRTLQPFAPHIKTLGDVYFDRVDPLFKVLHRPTAAALVAAAADSRTTGEARKGRGTDALLFAIYFAAVTCLGDQECGELFQQDRVRLVAQYKSGVENALVQADWLNTTDLATLQAFLIYLVCSDSISYEHMFKVRLKAAGRADCST